MNNSSRRSILCPNCRKLISRDEPRCPHCGVAAPGSAWKNWTTLFFRHPQHLIRFILWTNGIMFVISLLISGRSMGVHLNPFSMLSPDSNVLGLMGATGTAVMGNGQRWWTLLSANYLHGSILHIIFNMMAFMQLAPLVIREYGTRRMFIIYTGGGIIGFLISYLAGIRLTIGASAAICALIGALLYYGKSRSGIYGQLLYRQVGGWAFSIFIFGLIVPGINNWGHGGGMAAGAALGFLLGYQEKIKETLLHNTLAMLFLGLTVLTLGWSILQTALFLLSGFV